MTALDQLHPLVGVKQACQARYCRFRVPPGTDVGDAFSLLRLCHLQKKRGRHSPRALSENEQSAVLACLHEERFQDCSPAQVYAALLDEGRLGLDWSGSTGHLRRKILPKLSRRVSHCC